MKNQNYIVLGLSALAVYFIVKARPAIVDQAKAALGLSVLTKSPEYWASKDIVNDVAKQYQAYAYGRQGL